MSDNPYQSPTTDAQIVGVLSGKREDLLRVAQSQKGIIICILVQLVTFVFQFALPIEIRPILGLGFFGVGVVGTVFVFMLAIRVYGTGMGIFLGILALIPCIGLIVLLTVNGKATSVLRQNGIKVGFLGANLGEI